MAFNLFVRNNPYKICLMAILTAVCFLSCSSSLDYTVVSIKESNVVIVSLSRRMRPDTLMMIADKVRHLCDSENSCMVSFVIPSEYEYEHIEGDSLLAPWANAHFSNSDTLVDVNKSLIIYGSLTDQHKKCLININGNAGAMVGKWYSPYAMGERIVIIEKEDSSFILKSYQFNRYNEYNGMPDKESLELMQNGCEIGENSIYYSETILFCTSDSNHFRYSDYPGDIYRIMPNGNLEEIIPNSSRFYRRVK